MIEIYKQFYSHDFKILVVVDVVFVAIFLLRIKFNYLIIKLKGI